MLCTRTHILIAATLATCALAAPVGGPLAAQSRNATIGAGVGRLLAASNAFFKRYAADESFARELTDAVQRHDHAAAAGLVSKATGLPQSQIRVTLVERDASGSGAGGVGAASAGPGHTSLHGPHTLATVVDPRGWSALRLSVSICLGDGMINGCYTFDWPW